MPQRDKQLPCYGSCQSCGKLSYTTRKDARRSASRYPGAHHLNAYPCPHGQGWHLGHLRPEVIQGHLDRTSYQHRQPERTNQ
jgi:predicted secreted protein